jgi:two-component system response regulator FlrC
MDCWVLVIDDDPGTREALVDILRRAGYQVTTLKGDVGLAAALSSRSYQVAVVDYHLPDLNGLMVAEHLKVFQPDCRVVLMSSELPNLAETPPHSEVVDRFLAKPFSKDAILEVIAQLCPSRAR